MIYKKVQTHCVATTKLLRHHRRLATSGRHHGSQLSHRKRSGNGRKRHLKVHQLTKISKLIQQMTQQRQQRCHFN